MQNRQYGTVIYGIDEFVGMPSCRQRPGFGLAIPDHTGHDQIGIVECGTIGVGKRIPQLTAFVNRTGRFGCRMARNASRERKLREQFFHPLFIFRNIWVKLAVGSFQIGIGHKRRTAVSGPRHKNHVQIILFDDPVHMHINEIQTWSRSPVSQQSRLDIFRRQRFFQQWIVVQVNLSDREVIGRVEVIIDFAQHVRRKWSCILVWLFRIHTHIHFLSVLWYPDFAGRGRIQIPMIQVMASERQPY